MPSRNRPRKRHVQLELQRFDKNGQKRVGPHPRAGRPPKGARAGSPHKRRVEIDPRHPQHVTLRVVREVGWLRRPHAYRAIRRALGVIADGHDKFRIVHFSLQGDHVHLLCEANDKRALSRGLQGFQISAAKHLNREVSRKRSEKRRGQVFADRYHVSSINSVRQVRHALSYVLNNWRKHHQDRETAGLYEGRIDPFSSGVWFIGWKERTQPIEIPPDYEAPRVATPHTWYLTEGYKRAAPISVFEVPGAREA